MKNLLLTVVAAASLTSNSLAEKPKPNPADFTITVHVVFSHNIPSPAGAYQQLEVVIDGTQVVLQCNTAQGVLPLGDYKAKRIDTGNWKGILSSKSQRL